MPGATAVTFFARGSIRVTVPSSDLTLPCRLSTSRIGGAISPSDRMPVATW